MMRHLLALLALGCAALAGGEANRMVQLDLARIGGIGAEAGTRINALRRPCLLLRPGPAEARSHLGGRPRLAAPGDWPQRAGRPLALIAALDLGELNARRHVPDLPAAGMLHLFYDRVDEVWGYDPAVRDHFRVVHVAAPPAEETAFPDGLPAEQRLPERRLAALRSLDWPDLEVLTARGVQLDRSQEAVYTALQAKVAELNGGHKLGGFANAIQGDMTVECQLVTNGLYCGDETGYRDPRAKALRPGAVDWNLALQIDSDEAAGLMWGDSGMLYLWLRSQDLARGDWARSWLILQCY